MFGKGIKWNESWEPVARWSRWVVVEMVIIRETKKNLWIFSSFFSISLLLNKKYSSFFIPQFIIIIYIFSPSLLLLLFIYFLLTILLLLFFMNCCKWWKKIFYPWKIISFHASPKKNNIHWNCIYLTTLKLDQNNSAFNIHHIPSSVSLETPSERSASVEPSNHEQKSSLTLNLPNGNIPNSRKTSFSSTIVTIPDDHKPLTVPSQSQQEPQSSSRKLSKLSIIDPIDSICWRYDDDLLAISVVKHFIHLILFKEVI